MKYSMNIHPRFRGQENPGGYLEPPPRFSKLVSSRVACLNIGEAGPWHQFVSVCGFFFTKKMLNNFWASNIGHYRVIMMLRR